MARNLVHSTTHTYTDRAGKRRIATVAVGCPFGLSVTDEFYLWGLLALTVRQQGNDGELHATPHWCLRRLGVIDQHARRGGRQYEQFGAAVRRLAGVSYASDGFYDPVREEHRQVAFGLLSYSLPVAADSTRAWRFVWDRVFFEMVSAAAGQFQFDLDLYRSLGPASRRLFLFARKVFARRDALPTLRLRALVVDLLGFSPTMADKHLKQKLRRCVAELQDVDVVSDVVFKRDSRGQLVVRLVKGKGVERPCPSASDTAEQGPLWDALMALGFGARHAKSLIRQYPSRLLGEWIDITQAAGERFGRSYFRRSPQAFLIDGLKNASQGTRTPPDWWRELRTQEDRSREQHVRRAAFERIRASIFDDESPASPSGEPLATVGEIIRSGSV